MDAELRRLESDEVEAAIAELDGWTVTDGKLCRQYVFGDFVEAMGFMVQAAIWAQVLDHHPDWSNVYKTVDVELETHDVGGITVLDLQLARKMNEIAEPIRVLKSRRRTVSAR